ncbi:MAG TPA: L-threonylcarbamoyladenylate synthase [Rhabdochlamydiaceae bacterium]|nr:L-threonylcarbamoyladenylate synthase [Rhabdochlamydiaceae bacterium]
MKLITVDLAIEQLKQGNLVAFPTETVYGLGAPIFNERAVTQIFTAKGRPADNPLIAHISSLDQVNEIAMDIPADFYKLAAHFFPGPLTVILKKHPRVPAIVSGGLDTIAVRMPRHPIAQQLISGIGEPVVAPSANLSGKPSSTTAQHVLSDFSGIAGFVVDGGNTELGIESSVVNLNTKTMLRPGTLTQTEIEAILGYSLRVAEEKSSPGMRYKHYCPKARVRLFTNQEAFETYPSSHKYCHLTMSNLYAVLRAADDQGLEEICIFCDAEMVQNRGLMDRLERASFQQP